MSAAVPTYGYTPAANRRGSVFDDNADGDDEPRSWWRPPLGSLLGAGGPI